ncbi:MAG: YebC/PmpR family DNA-binding transcriptional regulator [Myxococcota bacterium]|nr:YebC/PmpR family DNA-binding transcriptional regulator [Myxococcota bacterium]
MGRFFEARKHTIMARNKAVSKAFTRVIREITTAVKAGGEDPDSNPALRRAIQNGRAVSMPRDKIEGAIKRALGADSDDWAEAIYEGYAPHGVAVMVVAATNNPTRTVANVRHAFKKNGGNMGATGSVSFQFKRMGVFRIKPEAIEDPEMLELEMIDHGLEEMGESVDDNGDAIWVLRCGFEEFGTLQAGLEESNVEVTSTALEHVPDTLIELGDSEVEDVMKMVAVLEDDEDVNHVFHNLG